MYPRSTVQTPLLTGCHNSTRSAENSTRSAENSARSAGTAHPCTQGSLATLNDTFRPLTSILGTCGCGSRLEVFSVVGSRSEGFGRPPGDGDVEFGEAGVDEHGV